MDRQVSVAPTVYCVPVHEGFGAPGIVLAPVSLYRQIQVKSAYAVDVVAGAVGVVV